MADALLIVGVTIAICVLVEHVAVIERYSLKDRIPGLLMNIIGTTLGIALMWPIGLLWDQVDPALRIPLWDWVQPLGFAGQIIQFATLIVIADFLAYWRHRVEHSRWWWPVHKVHHSPRELHASNNIGHPFQAFFSFLCIGVPMSLIKIDGPATPLAVGLTVSFLAVYIHSPIDFHFGPLRRVLVDNRFHRIHHSLETRHLDKNFGICFSLWDQMFGTAYWPAKDEWPEVGVDGVAAPKTVKDFLLLPFVPVRRGERLPEDKRRRRNSRESRPAEAAR